MRRLGLILEAVICYILRKIFNQHQHPSLKAAVIVPRKEITSLDLPMTKPVRSVSKAQCYAISALICMAGLAVAFGVTALLNRPAPRSLVAASPTPAEIGVLVESPAPTPPEPPVSTLVSTEAVIPENSPREWSAADHAAMPSAAGRSADSSGGHYVTPHHSPASHGSGDVWVNGYTRKDGTYVRGYSRRK